MLLYELFPGFYTGSSDTNGTDPFISASQQDSFRLGPHCRAGCGRRADPRADAKPPVLRAFCLLEVSPMAPFRDVAKLRCLWAQLFQLVQATVPTALVPRRGIRRAEVFMCQDKFSSIL
jgi:hypothetical protein